jgi:uncharacterized protein (TIGR02588 family)
VGILSAVLVAATIGFLILEGAASRDGARIPVIETGIDTVVRVSRGFVMRVEVRNTGDAPAEDVRIVGEMEVDGAITERAEAVLSLVPAGSGRLVGLLFSRDPRANPVTVRAVGFAIP